VLVLLFLPSFFYVFMFLDGGGGPAVKGSGRESIYFFFLLVFHMGHLSEAGLAVVRGVVVVVVVRAQAFHKS